MDFHPTGSGLGQPFGTFHQCLTELSPHDTIMVWYYRFTFLLDLFLGLPRMEYTYPIRFARISPHVNYFSNRNIVLNSKLLTLVTEESL